MAFVPGYEHDIFVSYAPVDNRPLYGATKGWVTTLIENLKTLLAQKLGSSDAYSLWIDFELAGRDNSQKVNPAASCRIFDQKIPKFKRDNDATRIAAASCGIFSQKGTGYDVWLYTWDDWLTL